MVGSKWHSSNARRATELRPDDGPVALAFATVLYRQGNILAAIPAHRQAVALAPDNPIGWTALGDCLVAVGQHDEAIASFRHALTLDPDQLAARRSLAACGRPGAQAEDIARLSALLAQEDALRSLSAARDARTAEFQQLRAAQSAIRLARTALDAEREQRVRLLARLGGAQATSRPR